MFSLKVYSPSVPPYVGFSPASGGVPKRLSSALTLRRIPSYSLFPIMDAIFIPGSGTTNAEDTNRRFVFRAWRKDHASIRAGRSAGCSVWWMSLRLCWTPPGFRCLRRWTDRPYSPLENDPYELRNPAGLDSYRDISDRLKQRLLKRILSVEGETPEIVDAEKRSGGQAILPANQMSV